MAQPKLKPIEERDPYAAMVMDAFDRIFPKPEDFAAGALVAVKTFDWQEGEVEFRARIIGPSSASHVRIRTDDGLVFLAPAADCTPIDEEANP